MEHQEELRELGQPGPCLRLTLSQLTADTMPKTEMMLHQASKTERSCR